MKTNKLTGLVIAVGLIAVLAGCEYTKYMPPEGAVVPEVKDVDTGVESSGLYEQIKALEEQIAAAQAANTANSAEAKALIEALQKQIDELKKKLDEMTNENPPPPPELKGEGDQCMVNADCEEGLFCVAGKCSKIHIQAPKKGEGDQCVTTADCASSLFCVANKCSKIKIQAPKKKEGGKCTKTEDCSEGLFCVADKCSKVDFGGLADGLNKKTENEFKIEPQGALAVSGGAEVYNGVFKEENCAKWSVTAMSQSFQWEGKNVNSFEIVNKESPITPVKIDVKKSDLPPELQEGQLTIERNNIYFFIPNVWPLTMKFLIKVTYEDDSQVGVEFTESPSSVCLAGVVMTYGEWGQKEVLFSK